MSRKAIAEGWTQHRLSSLRKRMQQQYLDAVVIPRWDAHQSEYVIERDELLAWASGFSGTWGLAIVTLSKAALFVDGRYTVQASSEVDTSAFEIRHLYDDPPHRWLANQVVKDDVVGFDPLVVPPQLHETLKAALVPEGARLSAIADNPIAGVWKDRPDSPSGKAFPMVFERAGERSSSKRKRLARALAERDADLLVETQSDNIAWLLNLRGRDIPDNPFLQAFALIDREGSVELFADRAKLEPLESFELEDVSIMPKDRFMHRLKERSADQGTILVDPRFGPSAALLAASAGGARAKVEPNPLTLLKARKNLKELSGISKACATDAIVLAQLFAWLEEEVPKACAAGSPLLEGQVEEKLQELRERQDEYVEPSFRPISASGPNGAMCHYNAPEGGGSPLGGDELYLLDTGGQYLSGTTDTTRTTVFGKGTVRQKLAYTLVLKGHIALATQRFPVGTKGYQLDAFARQHLWNEGLDYDHGTGHGVGHFLSVHEHPQRIGKEPVDVALERGMTVTIEPGHYLAGSYGIRIENLFEVVSEEEDWLGFRPLMYFPICRRLLEPDLLTASEIGWLDDYHGQTRKRFADADLPDRAQSWLERNTRPLEV